MNQLAAAANKSEQIYELAEARRGPGAIYLVSRCGGNTQSLEALRVRARTWTDVHGRTVQHSGCVEANSCVPVNLVLLLLLCLLSRGIRMVEDYERLFPWQPGLSNTVKYIVCVSKHRGVYVIPTWVVSKNNGTIENISDLPQISAILFHAHIFNKEFLLRGICVLKVGGSFVIASPPPAASCPSDIIVALVYAIADFI